MDLQNEFVGCSPMFPAPGAADLLPEISSFIGALRGLGVLIVFTRYVAPEDEALSAARRRTVRGIASAHRGFAAQLVAEIRPEPGDIVLDKPRQSAFFRTRLDEILRQRGIDSILIAGVTTNVCCIASARDAAARDYAVLMVSDLTAASDLPGVGGGRIAARTVQEVALAMVAHTIGEVASSMDVLERLRGGGSK